MVHAKILLQTSDKHTNWVKRFNTQQDFNAFKALKLESCDFIKYSIKDDNSTTYSKIKTEYGKSRKFSTRTDGDRYKNIISNENKVQKGSRNNQLALKGDKIISLSMTPARVRSLSKLIDTAPLTTKEVSILKSMFTVSKLSMAQYKLIEDIKHRASRRVKL